MCDGRTEDWKRLTGDPTLLRLVQYLQSAHIHEPDDAKKLCLSPIVPAIDNAASSSTCPSDSPGCPSKIARLPQRRARVKEDPLVGESVSIDGWSKRTEDLKVYWKLVEGVKRL